MSWSGVGVGVGVRTGLELVLAGGGVVWWMTFSAKVSLPTRQGESTLRMGRGDRCNNISGYKRVSSYVPPRVDSP
jgi:hypothetical protein